jgi:hypothetical protein
MHISVTVIPWLSVNLETHCILYKENRLLYEACCSSNNQDHVPQFNYSVLPSLTSSNVDRYWSPDLSLSQQTHYSCSISPHQTSEHFLLSHHTHFFHTTFFFTSNLTPIHPLLTLTTISVTTSTKYSLQFRSWSPTLSFVNLQFPFVNLLFHRRSRSRSYFTTDSQSVSLSWYRAPLWDLRPEITSCRNVAVWNLWSCIRGAPSLTRGWVCNFQCNHSMVRVAQNP